MIGLVATRGSVQWADLMINLSIQSPFYFFQYAGGALTPCFFSPVGILSFFPGSPSPSWFPSYVFFFCSGSLAAFVAPAAIFFPPLCSPPSQNFLLVVVLGNCSRPRRPPCLLVKTSLLFFKAPVPVHVLYKLFFSGPEGASPLSLSFFFFAS